MPSVRTSSSSEAEAATPDTPVVEGPKETGYYCPGCGRRSAYPRECTGPSAAAPHQPIEMVPAEELNGPPEKFTPAPNTDVV